MRPTFEKAVLQARSSSCCSLGCRLRGSGCLRSRSSSFRLVCSLVRWALCLRGAAAAGSAYHNSNGTYQHWQVKKLAIIESGSAGGSHTT